MCIDRYLIIHLRISISIYLSISLSLFICVYIYIYISLSLYIYIYIYSQLAEGREGQPVSDICGSGEVGLDLEASSFYATSGQSQITVSIRVLSVLVISMIISIICH